MGANVRYDGGHCYTPLLVEQLGDQFDLRPICPEVGIGMSIPRNPIQLINSDQGTCARGTVNKSIDVTEKLERFALACLQEKPIIYGYVFKSHSPSCGVHNTNVFNESSQLLDSGGTGIHAKTIIENRAGLPVADENQLQETRSIEDYCERVISYYKSQN